MTRTNFRLTAICVSAVAAIAAPLGCSSGSGVDTTTYCGKVAVTYCGNIMACCTGEERAAQLGELNVNDESKCQKDMATACEIQLAQTLWAVEQGTVEYDDALATKCLDAMKKPADACAVVAEVAPWAEACKEGAFKGKVAKGSECHFSVECVEGASCNSAKKCEAPPAEGERCDFTCAEGLYCKSHKCVKQRGSGEVCTSSSECAANLFCDKVNASDTDKKCQALKAVGATCTSDAQCETGDCGYGTCSLDGADCTTDFECDFLCVKSGDSCNSSFDCWDQFCETSGTVCTSSDDCSTGEQCIDDTCDTTVEEPTCDNRRCAAKPLKTFDYCSIM